MNKFWRIALSSLLVVSIWGAILSAFASYRAHNFGVVPTFPYYQLLMGQTSVNNAVWGHFDGVHYLKLASAGYIDEGTQAFFPAYPLLIHVTHFTGLSYFDSARLVSFLALIFSLICIQYLFNKRAWTIIAALLIFPTSFFFEAVYTESLFLFETLLFFLLISRKKYFLAAIIAAIASATRLAGSLLMISLLISIWPLLKERKYYLLLLPLSLAGLFGYMIFLNQRFGDPLAFIHVQTMFGAGRSGGEIVLLPQVIFRYIKMFVTVSPVNIIFQRALLEFTIFCTFLYFIIKNWSDRSFSWSVYLLGSLLLPTLSGTLSSIPRYVLVMLPFIITPNSKLNIRNSPYWIVSICMLFLLLSIFTYGQFVS